MNKKLLIGLMVIAAAIVLVLAGCFIEVDSGNVDLADAWGNPPVNETLTGYANGWGGRITVNLKFVDGVIKEVDITHNETRSIGGRLIDRVKPLIIKANSLEIDAISKASATVTAGGLMGAWEMIKGQITQ